MRSEYFEGQVVKVVEETKEMEIPTTKKVGWFKKIVYIEKHPQTEYYAICSLLGAKFLLKIPIKKGAYDSLAIGDNVSLHLEFDFEYACFHYVKPIEEPKTFEVVKGRLYD